MKLLGACRQTMEALAGMTMAFGNGHRGSQKGHVETATVDPSVPVPSSDVGDGFRAF